MAPSGGLMRLRQTSSPSTKHSSPRNQNASYCLLEFSATSVVFRRLRAHSRSLAEWPSASVVNMNLGFRRNIAQENRGLQQRAALVRPNALLISAITAGVLPAGEKLKASADHAIVGARNRPANTLRSPT